MSIKLSINERVGRYLVPQNLILTSIVGSGKDGSVWATSAGTAVKVHAYAESCHFERDAYIRLGELNITSISGFTVPLMRDHDDQLFALEMDLVSPPFIVDFASARLDFAPDLIEDEGNTFEDFVRSRFDERTDEVMGIYYELIRQAGIYLTDLHPQNIKFAKGVTFNCGGSVPSPGTPGEG